MEPQSASVNPRPSRRIRFNFYNVLERGLHNARKNISQVRGQSERAGPQSQWIYGHFQSQQRPLLVPARPEEETRNQQSNE